MEAKSEAHRLAAQRPRLFSNLSDRLLISKTLYLPGELVLVRYSLSPSVTTFNRC